jgi:hypothetical protein
MSGNMGIADWQASMTVKTVLPKKMYDSLLEEYICSERSKRFKTFSSNWWQDFTAYLKEEYTVSIFDGGPILSAWNISIENEKYLMILQLKHGTLNV